MPGTRPPLSTGLAAVLTEKSRLRIPGKSAGGGEFVRNTAGPKLAAKSVTTKAGRGV